MAKTHVKLVATHLQTIQQLVLRAQVRGVLVLLAAAFALSGCYSAPWVDIDNPVEPAPQSAIVDAGMVLIQTRFQRTKERIAEFEEKIVERFRNFPRHEIVSRFESEGGKCIRSVCSISFKQKYGNYQAHWLSINMTAKVCSVVDVVVTLGNNGGLTRATITKGRGLTGKPIDDEDCSNSF